MPRDFKVYLEDILEAIGRIRTYTEKHSFGTFLQDIIVQDAVIRNLGVIGEAAKKTPRSSGGSTRKRSGGRSRGCGTS
jgi:uncharacterized protein with HEPN domain